jgi:hypothetical protein
MHLTRSFPDLLTHAVYSRIKSEWTVLAGWHNCRIIATRYLGVGHLSFKASPMACSTSMHSHDLTYHTTRSDGMIGLLRARGPWDSRLLSKSLEA